MRTTLADLYTRHSARLAARVAARLDALGAGDPIADVDDVTQEVWLSVAELDVLPAKDQAWPALQRLADRAVQQREQVEHRRREVPSGMGLPAVRLLPPAPMPRVVVFADVEPMIVAA
ncbi:hypothetical protein [Streptomyces sp. NPDC058665]|uniref:hypothetical protein n=1 Tax=Streptomyces sp. NPDC058665 TaxID=3346586 RepID=UPI00364D166D